MLKQPSSGLLVKVILGLSLLFNAAVLAGFMLGGGPGRPNSAVRRPGPPPPIVDRALDALELSPAQRSTLEQLKREHGARMKSLNAEALALDESLDAALSAASAPSGRIRSILDRQAEIARDRRRAHAELFDRFHRVLNPKQRRELREQLDRRRGPPPPRERGLGTNHRGAGRQERGAGPEERER